ncbi:hypothetical protein BD408DRAFT_408004 [Parasitella parasitica]|nr:hypothetical protein BD408DRAFT_408004 [Parasitella parasitica]
MSLLPFRRAIHSNKRLPNSFSWPRRYTNIPEKAQEKALTGYRKYAQQFKSKPGSYMTTFAVLHELTAVAPFPFIYWALDASSVKIPFPDAVVSEGNRFINKARVYYGYEPLEAENRVMMNLVTTYCIVKALLPVRIAASVGMTPFFAERFVGPIVAYVRKRF